MFTVTEIPCPPLPPGSENGRAYRMGALKIIISIDAGDLHISVSHWDRLPTWEEMKWIRYTFAPPDITMAMIMPPPDDYVNLHEYCFHLFQIDRR